MRKKVKKSTLKTSTLAHARIDEHEKLCRIMQQQTNLQINDIKIEL
jgi:hypothetical protein